MFYAAARTGRKYRRRRRRRKPTKTGYVANTGILGAELWRGNWSGVTKRK